MKRYTKSPYSVTHLIFLGLALLTFSSCRDKPTDEVVAKIPTQRVIATKKMFLGISGVRPAVVDTVIIQGKIYESAGYDSTTFEYDQQDRLVRLNFIQNYFYGPDYPGGGENTVHTGRLSDYSYQPPNLVLRDTYEGQAQPTFSQSQLDGSYRRMASRTLYDAANSATYKDTLQLYSPEGLLISSRRIVTSSYPRQTYQQTSTLTDGNIVQTTTSCEEPWPMSMTTTYTYDLSHKGPLATMTMFGESSRHALLRATTVRNLFGIIDSYEYTYANEYDSTGRMVRQTTYYQPSGSTKREIQTLTKIHYQ